MLNTVRLSDFVAMAPELRSAAIAAAEQEIDAVAPSAANFDKGLRNWVAERRNRLATIKRILGL